MKESRFKYFLAAIVATGFWGFFSIPLRKLQAYPSDQILHYRIFTSLLITWLVILLFRKKQLKNDIQNIRSKTPEKRNRLIGLIVLAGLLVTANWFSFIYAVNHVSLTSAAFAYMICPLLTALGGFVILKEQLTNYKIASLSIALISIVILAQGSPRDVLWAVFIATLYAFYLIIQRVVVEIDKFTMLGIQLGLSTLLMLPLFIYHFNGIPSEPVFWITIVEISVFFTIIPLFLSLYALIGLPSSTMGILIYTNPIVAFAVAFFYFHERINSHQLLAYSLLAIAIVVFNWNLVSGLLVKPKHKELVK